MVAPKSAHCCRAGRPPSQMSTLTTMTTPVVPAGSGLPGAGRHHWHPSRPAALRCRPSLLRVHQPGEGPLSCR